MSLLKVIQIQMTKTLKCVCCVSVRQGSHRVGSWGQQGVQLVIELVDHGVDHGVGHGVSHDIGHRVIYGVMKCPQLLSRLTTITYNLSSC